MGPGKIKQQAIAYIEKAARLGMRCPSNEALAEHLGLSSARRAWEVMHEMEKAGLIRVQRASSLRVVTIAASGLRTAGEVGIPYRARRQSSRYEHIWTSNDDALLLHRVRLGEDFHQAGLYVGVNADSAARRYAALQGMAA